jgi:exosortase/archaeosortase family protein
MPLMVQGNTISSVGENPWNFDIAEGCSGVRSLMALAMIAAIYANYTQKPLWKKAFLFACALPLSLIGNFGRIFTILLLAHIGFEDFASQTYHDWAGMLIFFPIALCGLFAVDKLINPSPRKKLRRALQSAVATPSETATP